MSMAGYPVEWFAQTVDESYKCGICCQVLRDPTTTKCGHIYCSRCISSWVSYHGVCPERCRELEVDSLKPMRVGNLISGLAVHCKNKSIGCRVQVSLAEKHLHEDSCAYSRPTGLRRLLSKFSLSQQDLSKYNVNHKRTNSSGVGSSSRINPIAKTCKRSPSSAAALCRPSTAMPVVMVSSELAAILANQHLVGLA